MKRLRKIISLIIFYLICFTVGWTYFTWSVYLKSSIQSLRTLTAHQKQISYEKKSDIDICKKLGVMNDAWPDMVNDELWVIDDQILNAFANSDFDIYVSNIDIAKDMNIGEENGMILGETNMQTKRIYINQTEEAVHSAPVHEIGHWFDYYRDYPSLSSEFEEIFEKEGETFRDVFYDPIADECDAQEMFAEGFYLYYTDSDHLFMECPDLYCYLDSMIRKYVNHRNFFNRELMEFYRKLLY